MAKTKKGKLGGSFDAFLAEEGILETCEDLAVQQIVADQANAAVEKDSLKES